jgi:lactate dehydrogenase-like 2-hydroxyacid dehydrogenase
VARRSPELQQITLSGENCGKEPTRCTEDTFSYNWSEVEEIRTIWQSTVGILGMGEIGFELARRLRGFDCTVLYNKRNRLPEHTERELNVRCAGRDELVSTSDFVVSMLPLLPETGESLDEAFFAQMKPGACFISAGGSGTIDEAALAETISSGKLFGVGVDNFTWEPVRKDCPLLAPARNVRANVILTPHVAAGAVPSSQKDLRVQDYRNVINLLDGKMLAYRLV